MKQKTSMVSKTYLFNTDSKTHDNNFMFNNLLYIILIIIQTSLALFCNLGLQLSVLWRILVPASHVVPVNSEEKKTNFNSKLQRDM